MLILSQVKKSPIPQGCQGLSEFFPAGEVTHITPPLVYSEADPGAMNPP
jgi:hypothetical protein